MKIEFDIINPESNRFENQLLREKVKSAISTYAAKLPDIYSGLDDEALDNITIHVVDASNIDTHGEEAFTKRKCDNSEFVIAINQFNGPNDILLLLAHELCHVAQFLTGMIDDSMGNDSVTWLGNVYAFSSTPHQKRPWEQDALENQWKLYDAHPDTKRFHF